MFAILHRPIVKTSLINNRLFMRRNLGPKGASGKGEGVNIHVSAGISASVHTRFRNRTQCHLNWKTPTPSTCFHEKKRGGSPEVMPSRSHWILANAMPCTSEGKCARTKRSVTWGDAQGDTQSTLYPAICPASHEKGPDCSEPSWFYPFAIACAYRSLCVKRRLPDA